VTYFGAVSDLDLDLCPPDVYSWPFYDHLCQFA